MSKGYIISIDQSTQGTKALLFDHKGRLLKRKDKSHQQIINEKGWVSHDGEEIYRNTIEVVGQLISEAGIDGEEVAALGISNQRETVLAWDAQTGRPIAHAIVWQCSRAEEICERDSLQAHGDAIRERTGIPLSPYFPAAKYAWLLENVPKAGELQAEKRLCLGTVDSYLVFRLTGGNHRTDYSNASRTQLFHLEKGCYDAEICDWFHIPMECLPQIEDSDGNYGMTDMEGIFKKPVPIHAVLGDSHAALFGQACLKKGMVKATYGTGSSIMMNVGDVPVFSKAGVVSSVGFKINQKLSYVLEGNLNYTGAVITWLKKDLELIGSDGETQELAYAANPADHTCIVPAFSGLGAPYWDSNARAAIIGMTRTTKKAEIVKAALSCIAQQIADIVEAMEQDSGIRVEELRVDGGPTRNTFLMQLQSDLLGSRVQVPDVEELSGSGAAYAAGMAVGLYDEAVFESVQRKAYQSAMSARQREEERRIWKAAVEKVLEK